MPIGTLQQEIADTLVAQKEACTKIPADRVDENTKTTKGGSSGVRRNEETYVEQNGSVWVRQENLAKKLEKGDSDRSDSYGNIRKETVSQLATLHQVAEKNRKKADRLRELRR